MTSFTISIDWERNGSFSDTQDNVTAYVMQANWFLGMRQVYQDVADNSMLTLVLNNTDRRFSPESDKLADGATANPLFGKVKPFKPVRITSHDGVTTRVHWQGWIDAIQPAVNQYGQRTVKILASGSLQFYKAAEANLPLQENKRTDEIIGELLKRVVIPPALNRAWLLGREGNSELTLTSFLADTTAYSTLDEGRLKIAMAADNWVKEGGMTNAPKDTFDVHQAIQEVTASEHGKFFFDREGKAVFWNRHHTMINKAPDANFDNVMHEMAYVYAGIEEIKNEVVVIAHPRSISATADVVLWELKDSIVRVQPGETKTFFVKYEDESKNRIGARDVTITDVTYEQGTATVTIDAQANGAEIKAVNTGTEAALIKSLKVKGRKIVDQGEIEVKSINNASLIDYGRRVLRMNMPSIDSMEQAQYIADFERDRRSVARGDATSASFYSHGIRGSDVGHPTHTLHTQQLARTIGDLITVKEKQTGNSKNYIIIGEAHELTMGATLWKTTWYLEPAPSVYPWKLDQDSAPATGRSILGLSTRLAF